MLGSRGQGQLLQAGEVRESLLKEITPDVKADAVSQVTVAGRGDGR